MVAMEGGDCGSPQSGSCGLEERGGKRLIPLDV